MELIPNEQHPQQTAECNEENKNNGTIRFNEDLMMIVAHTFDEMRILSFNAYVQAIEASYVHRRKIEQNAFS